MFMFKTAELVSITVTECFTVSQLKRKYINQSFVVTWKKDNLICPWISGQKDFWNRVSMKCLPSSKYITLHCMPNFLTPPLSNCQVSVLLLEWREIKGRCRRNHKTREASLRPIRFYVHSTVLAAQFVPCNFWMVLIVQKGSSKNIRLGSIHLKITV